MNKINFFSALSQMNNSNKNKSVQELSHLLKNQSNQYFQLLERESFLSGIVEDKSIGMKIKYAASEELTLTKTVLKTIASNLQDIFQEINELKASKIDDKEREYLVIFSAELQELRQRIISKIENESKENYSFKIN